MLNEICNYVFQLYQSANIQQNKYQSAKQTKESSATLLCLTSCFIHLNSFAVGA